MLLSEMINSLVWRWNPKTRLCAASQAKTYDSAVEHLLPDPLQPGESGTFFHTTQPFQQLSWYPRQVHSCMRSVQFVTDVVHTYHITNPTAGPLSVWAAYMSQPSRYCNVGHAFPGGVERGGEDFVRHSCCSISLSGMLLLCMAMQRLFIARNMSAYICAAIVKLQAHTLCISDWVFQRVH